MLDTAAIIISQGKKIAYAYAEGVNDNMIQSHFHDFFELYYLLDGERLHMIEGETYHFTANDFVLFPRISCTIPMVRKICLLKELSSILHRI